MVVVVVGCVVVEEEEKNPERRGVLGIIFVSFFFRFGAEATTSLYAHAGHLFSPIFLLSLSLFLDAALFFLPCVLLRLFVGHQE